MTKTACPRDPATTETRAARVLVFAFLVAQGISGPGCASDGPSDPKGAQEGVVEAGGTPFAHCEPARRPSFDTEECVVERFCATMECGTPTSHFDGDGCLRPGCGSDEACGNGSRCLHTALLLREGQCVASTVGSCYQDDEVCGCMRSADCGFLAHCVPDSLYEELSLCDAASLTCEEIEGLHALVSAVNGSEPPLSFLPVLRACFDAVKDRHAELDCETPLAID
jgi:hypothetical protein